MENTNISWCDNTNNFWWGCMKVHKGCDNCYAEEWANRFHDNLWGKGSARCIVKSAFPSLSKWQRKALKENKLTKVFVGSMMDIFEKPMKRSGILEKY